MSCSQYRSSSPWIVSEPATCVGNKLKQPWPSYMSLPKNLKPPSSLLIDVHDHDDRIDQEELETYYRMEDCGRVDMIVTPNSPNSSFHRSSSSSLSMVATLCDGHNSLALSPYHYYGGYECADYVSYNLNRLIIQHFGLSHAPSSVDDQDSINTQNHNTLNINFNNFKDEEIVDVLKKLYLQLDDQLCKSMLHYRHVKDIIDSPMNDELQTSHHDIVNINYHSLLKPLCKQYLDTSYFYKRHLFEKLVQARRVVLERHFPISSYEQMQKVKNNENNIIHTLQRWCSRIALLHDPKRSSFASLSSSSSTTSSSSSTTSSSSSTTSSSSSTFYRRKNAPTISCSPTHTRPLHSDAYSYYNGLCFLDQHNHVIAEPEFGCTSTTLCAISDVSVSNDQPQLSSMRVFMANVGDTSAYLFPFNPTTGKYDIAPLKLTQNHDMTAHEDIEIYKRYSNGIQQNLKERMMDHCSVTNSSLVGTRQSFNYDGLIIQDYTQIYLYDDMSSSSSAPMSSPSLLHPDIKFQTHTPSLSPTRVTNDHKNRFERCEIVPEARRYTSTLTRSFGHPSFWKHHGMHATPCIHSCKIDPLDVIVMATDGFWFENHLHHSRDEHPMSNTNSTTNQSHLLHYIQNLLTQSLQQDPNYKYYHESTDFKSLGNTMLTWSVKQKKRNYKNQTFLAAQKDTLSSSPVAAHSTACSFRQDNAAVLAFLYQP